VTSTPDWPDDDTTEPAPPAGPEGNLGQLDDDTYFQSIDEFPGAVDEHGRPVEGLFDDVIDARDDKLREVEDGGAV
jgi:hypothetical protein